MKKKLNLAATVEALLFYLEKYQSCLCYWDESSTFMGSFGRYSGASNGSYDRSIYLELANAPSEFRRDLKGTRCYIEEPRLSLCLLGNKFI